MAELCYAFIKNGIVQEVAVFAEENDELASQVSNSLNCDEFVWVGDNPPSMYSVWNGKTFTAPTEATSAVK